MGLGFVVVVTAIGLFVLAPLALAWVSTDPRRWSRVEGMLGRDLPTGHDRVPRWLPWGLIAAGVAYLAGAMLMARDRDTPRLFPFWALTGIVYVLLGITHLIARRRQERKAASVQSQVEGRAEPGGPGPGG